MSDEGVADVELGDVFDGGYRLTGTKTWITNSQEGDCLALLVKTDKTATPPHRGMSLFIAEKGPGFAVTRKLEKLGVWNEIHEELRVSSRAIDGRHDEPSAAIIDSQSVKTTEKKGRAATTEARKSKDESVICSSTPTD